MEQTDVRLRAAKDDLADAVAWVARSLPTRPTQPILRGMVFVATLSNGTKISGVFTNKLGNGWSPIDGFGMVNAEKAVLGR